MEFNLEPLPLKNRFLGALKKNKLYKENFKDIEESAARKIIENYTLDKGEIDSLVKATCTDNSISGFML